MVGQAVDQQKNWVPKMKVGKVPKIFRLPHLSRIHTACIGEDSSIVPEMFGELMWKISRCSYIIRIADFPMFSDKDYLEPVI